MLARTRFDNPGYTVLYCINEVNLIPSQHMMPKYLFKEGLGFAENVL